jgi:hypothetical protein
MQNAVINKIKSQIAYGKFGEGRVPLNKIKGWMFADDLINLYHGR